MDHHGLARQGSQVPLSHIAEHGCAGTSLPPFQGGEGGSRSYGRLVMELFRLLMMALRGNRISGKDRSAR